MAGEQKPSSNLLEQFILLAKGTNGSALTALISQVLEAPGVYVFGELLELANVQEVRVASRQFLFVLNLSVIFQISKAFNAGGLQTCRYPVESGMPVSGPEEVIKGDVWGSFHSIFSPNLRKT